MEISFQMETLTRSHDYERNETKVVRHIPIRNECVFYRRLCLPLNSALGSRLNHRILLSSQSLPNEHLIINN
jgi:hypothetical protein